MLPIVGKPSAESGWFIPDQLEPLQGRGDRVGHVYRIAAKQLAELARLRQGPVARPPIRRLVSRRMRRNQPKKESLLMSAHERPWPRSGPDRVDRPSYWPTPALIHRVAVTNHGKTQSDDLRYIRSLVVRLRAWWRRRRQRHPDRH